LLPDEHSPMIRCIRPILPIFGSFCTALGLVDGIRLADRELDTVFRKAQKVCETDFFLTLETCVQPLDDGSTYVITGDIDAMWIRDSSATMIPYISLASGSLASGGEASRFRNLVEGVLRRQAQFIRTDPYANSYTKAYGSTTDDRLNRGAYVFTGNYEVDSGAYFFRLLERIMTSFPDAKLITEAPIHGAAKILVAMYRQERHHFNDSHYVYPKWEPYELPGPSGAGLPAGYTGMVWGAFRPSDDAQHFGYLIPSNLFLASTLPSIVEYARGQWNDEALAQDAEDLRASIVEGVHKFGTRIVNSKEVYCYEVDGLGGCRLMDDANVPSLLSLPYLDPAMSVFKQDIYRSTREWILSSQNPWYFVGTAGKGIGSPHTGVDRIWPLSIIMEAITASNPNERHDAIALLMSLQVENHGLTESFQKDNSSEITRAWFAWPDALFAELMISLKRCAPNVSTVTFPPYFPAPRTGPLAQLPAYVNFYDADPTLLMREGVALPEGFPGPNHAAASTPADTVF